MLGLLVDSGYLDEGLTVQEFYDVLRRASRGEEVFSRLDADQVEAYRAAVEFGAAMSDMGIDVKAPVDEIIGKLPGFSRNQPVQKAKAGEAGRAETRSGKAEDAADARMDAAIERLDKATYALDDFKTTVGPKVRKEIADANKELAKVKSLLRDAKKERAQMDFRANMDDNEIIEAVEGVRRNIRGLKPGEGHFRAGLGSPMHARALDVPSQEILPWLDTNAEVVLAQYFNQTVPEIEMRKRFGSSDLQFELKQVEEEYDALMAKTKPNSRERRRLATEQRRAMRDLEGIRDRLLGKYGVPKDPDSFWVTGGRTARTLSYMGYMGNVVLASIPDSARIIGTNITEAVGGLPSSFMNPKALMASASESWDMLGAVEMALNSRAQSIHELFDPFGRGSRLERNLAEAGNKFSMVSGIVPWNAMMKTISGIYTSSRLAKAVLAADAGKASKKQLRTLAANYIDASNWGRIARQLEKHGEKADNFFVPHGDAWDDPAAFEAFRVAMYRETNDQVISLGQEVPLAFSTELGKFLLQFKRFAFSMHHRMVMAGVTKADAETFSTAVMMLGLGVVVSRLRADLQGYDQKEGAALWEDAVDRSGLAGWLMEPYNMLSAATGGATSLSGETVSRFQSRNAGAGLAGPSADMIIGFGWEGVPAAVAGKGSYRDARKLMRPIPGNNAVHLQFIAQQIEDAIVGTFGFRPREE